MYIGSIDIETIKALERKQARLAKRIKFFEEQASHQPLSLSAALSDFDSEASGLVSPTDLHHSLPMQFFKMLARFLTKKHRKLLNSGFVSNDKEIVGLYFDGRKDKTITKEKRGSRYHRKTIAEAHIVLFSKPGSQYIGHVAPPSGTANVSTLVAIDGTAVNTGSKNGATALTEKQLNPAFALVYLLTTRKRATTASSF
nr:unnamed protein product [Callosobruchus analis]